MSIKLKLIIYIIVSLILFGFIYFYFNYNPSENRIFPRCPFYSITGFYCPGCGSQRAIHGLLHGRIVGGLKHNPLILLLVFVLVYDATIFVLKKLYNKKTNNLLHKPRTTNIILFIIIIFWILRNIKLYPFTILAP